MEEGNTADLYNQATKKNTNDRHTIGTNDMKPMKKEQTREGAEDTQENQWGKRGEKGEEWPGLMTIPPVTQDQQK